MGLVWSVWFAPSVREEHSLNFSSSDYLISLEQSGTLFWQEMFFLERLFAFVVFVRPGIG